MNIKTFVKLFSLLVAFAVAQTALGADDGTYAVLNSWEKGSYTLLQECTNTLFKAVDKAETERDESRLLFNWQIDAQAEGNDGVQKLNMKMLRVMMSVRVNGKEVIYFDSSNGKAKSEILNAVFKKMKDSAVTVVFKNGVPSEVLGCDNFWKNLPEPKTDEEQAMLANVKSLAAADNIKQTFETLVYLDSPKEVAVGDVWKNSTVFPIPVVGDKTLEWECSLDKVATVGGVPMATVSGKGKVDFEFEGQAKGAVNVKMESKVVYNAASYFSSDVDSRVYVTLNAKTGDGSEKHDETYTAFLKNKLSVAKH